VALQASRWDEFAHKRALIRMKHYLVSETMSEIAFQMIFTRLVGFADRGEWNSAVMCAHCMAG
jgi:hypothetical protein